MTQRLEQQLDESIRRLGEGKSIDQALAPCPDQSDQLRPLLGIARNLQLLPGPALSAQSVMRTFIKASESQVEEARAERSRVRFFS